MAGCYICLALFALQVTAATYDSPHYDADSDDDDSLDGSEYLPLPNVSD